MGGVPHTAASLGHVAAWLEAHGEALRSVAFAPAQPAERPLEVIHPPDEALAALGMRGEALDAWCDEASEAVRHHSYGAWGDGESELR